MRYRIDSPKDRLSNWSHRPTPTVMAGLDPAIYRDTAVA